MIQFCRLVFSPQRFQKLYSSYEAEDSAEKVQLNALHQQHVQASLNEHKRVTMDKYMKSLDEGDVSVLPSYGLSVLCVVGLSTILI